MSADIAERFFNACYFGKGMEYSKKELILQTWFDVRSTIKKEDCEWGKIIS